MSKFNLETEVARAEAGDQSAWEGIARHLLAKKPKPRKAKSGPQTWAHVTLADGRQFLTSCYSRGTDQATLNGHVETAQFRARMEDSGDRSNFGQDAPVNKYGQRLVTSFDFEKRAFLNPAIPAVPAASVKIISDGEEIEQVREACFVQRAFRQGWIGEYRKQQEEEARIIAAALAESEARFEASQQNEGVAA